MSPELAAYPAAGTSLLDICLCKLEPEASMPTNLTMDDDLLERARKISGLASERATVNEALKEFIARHCDLKVFPV